MRQFAEIIVISLGDLGSFLYQTYNRYYLVKPSFDDIGHNSSLNPPNKLSHLRGAAHDFCNLKMQQQKRVIVFFHNAKGYDNHFLIESLASHPHVGEIDVLGQTSEKYTRMSTSRFIIQDSMSHLIGSLDSLSSSLRQRGVDGFDLVRSEFPDDRKFECCLRKLVYPYDYIDDFNKFDEPIPGREAFYNKLNDEELAAEEYKRLIETCRLFKIRTLGQLHDLYLKIDVLILACVFEDYRRLGLDIFRLDPCYYVSSPSYSFDAMLWTTKVELELLTDPEMYSFFEKGRESKKTLINFNQTNFLGNENSSHIVQVTNFAGLRGGCSSVFKRLATANNAEADFNYDARCEESHIFYMVCTSLK